MTNALSRFAVSALFIACAASTTAAEPLCPHSGKPLHEDPACGGNVMGGTNPCMGDCGARVRTDDEDTPACRACRAKTPTGLPLRATP